MDPSRLTVCSSDLQHGWPVRIVRVDEGNLAVCRALNRYADVHVRQLARHTREIHWNTILHSITRLLRVIVTENVEHSVRPHRDAHLQVGELTLLGVGCMQQRAFGLHQRLDTEPGLVQCEVNLLDDGQEKQIVQWWDDDTCVCPPPTSHRSRTRTFWQFATMKIGLSWPTVVQNVRLPVMWAVYDACVPVCLLACGLTIIL